MLQNCQLNRNRHIEKGRFTYLLNPSIGLKQQTRSPTCSMCHFNFTLQNKSLKFTKPCLKSGNSILYFVSKIEIKQNMGEVAQKKGKNMGVTGPPKLTLQDPYFVC